MSVCSPPVGLFAWGSRSPTWGGSLVEVVVFVVVIVIVVAYTGGTSAWHWIVRWRKDFVLDSWDS